ncbi:MAG: clan AA aspartic protease [Pleurocapsa sp. MO_226.B13]|nr:clan AA aspartic protease [Pleurocapsa sp. MO_226.B13]
MVTDGYVTVPVTFCLPNQPSLDIQFVIDTGFTDYLCLPSEAIAVLGLPFLYDLPANLANNSNVILPVHEATIMWHRSPIKVRVLATERRPLLGKALLERKFLVIYKL